MEKDIKSVRPIQAGPLKTPPLDTIQSLLMVTPVALEGWHNKKTVKVITQKTQYPLFMDLLFYLSYPLLVMPRASVVRRRVLTNDGPCYLSLVHSRLVTHVLVTRPSRSLHVRHSLGSLVSRFVGDTRGRVERVSEM